MEISREKCSEVEISRGVLRRFLEKSLQEKTFLERKALRSGDF